MVVLSLQCCVQSSSYLTYFEGSKGGILLDGNPDSPVDEDSSLWPFGVVRRRPINTY